MSIAPIPVQSIAERPRLVVVVNGRPRAGKDTTVTLMQAHFTIAGWTLVEFSSIQPVKDLMLKAGVITPKDLAEKSDELRDMLAEIGDSLQKFNGFRTRGVVDRFNGLAWRTEGPLVLVVHMREPILIEQLRATFEAKGVPFKVVVVKNDRVPAITSNAADAGVEGTVWDYAVENQRDIAFLATQVSQLVPALIEAAKRGVQG